MNAITLLEWEQKHNAINLTIESFWKCFKKWKEENKDDYHATFQGKLYDDFISVSERSISLRLNFGSQHVVMFCSIDIMYLEEHIGDYTIEFFLDGEIADDYLDFGDKTLRDYRISKIKHNLRIARSSIKEGLSLEVISKITKLDVKYLKILKEKYC